ncbi:ABC transporter substrate-binding protein [Pseudoflavonifractor sp. BIOML-A6]|nr:MULTISPECIES: ABC transporter substrate-binding protein [unclassified Pseudoflavonifractor]MTQ96458.1 ABC transporter substrate-binding protein [Pseudoflavonifractor sp. BIOML-A16]MTR05848.1 ABC transporter substrate-binding protein [Pseudoflavonifractor sp. BIOML-A15]MTR72561.1 ABC transporter substrate-binding protein [Pseudoflavonifractor sp. BIOML-A18]MTS63630.1 ABC transporter substrate-binding protein [Pseudoflavonifractor sp. BIOML-A5]MTS72345.1 ABC transporter substrate-binding prot
MQKKALSLLLALAMVFSLAACAQTPAQPGTDPTPSASGSPSPSAAPSAEPSVEPTAAGTRSFTDSCGRTVEIPADISRIAPSGPMAQIVLFALAPDKFVGIASKWSKETESFIDGSYYNLPVLGQLYGSSAGELNLETLAAADPQVIIDIGEPKKTIAEDMDAMSEQLGIPAVHIDAYTATMGDTYRLLGELLGLEEEAAVLADYCDERYSGTLSLMERVGGNRANVLYCLGDQGLNVIAKDSYHGEVLDLMTNNLAVVDAPSSKGTGNESDMEQLILWDPDVILFAPQSIYATVDGDATWQSLKAIRNGSYYEVPFGPYNWMGFPPSVNRYLGMLWMGSLLYPEYVDYDLYTEVARYYKLFYHCDLTQEQFDALTANSTGKK